MGDVAALEIVRPSPAGPGALWPGLRARRCLFGAPDPDCTREFLERETKNLEQRNRERWNFDFVLEQPLPGGRYEWFRDDVKDTAVADQEHPAPECSPPATRKQEQKLITDFMRKRKLPSHHDVTDKKETSESEPKTRRRFST